MERGRPLADSPEVQEVALSHEYYPGATMPSCSCGKDVDSPWQYNQHFIAALDDAGVLGGRKMHLRAAGLIVMGAEQYDRMMEDDADV